MIKICYFCAEKINIDWEKACCQSCWRELEEEIAFL